MQHVENKIQKPELQIPFLSRDSTSIFLTLPSKINIYIKNGNSISFERLTRLDDNFIRDFICFTAMAIIFIQRGMPVFKGSCFELNGHTISVLGSSGLGKSAICASMALSGGKLITDDILVISDDLKVLKGPAYAKIWLDSLVELGINHEEYCRTQANLNRFNVPLPILQESSSTIEQIYILDFWEGDSILINTIEGGDKLNRLIRAAYQDSYITSDTRSDMVMRYIKIAQQVPVKIVRRPQSGVPILSIAERILADSEL